MTNQSELQGLVNELGKIELIDINDYPDAVKELQRLLSDSGYDVGQIDGIVGNQTLTAFAQFKQDNYQSYPTILGGGSLKVLIQSRRNNNPTPYSAEPRNRVILGHKIIPGGSFTWNEATHGGTRPVKGQVKHNVIELAKAIQPWRDKIGKPFHVTSWYRPPSVNKRIGGAKFSQHLYGRAVDFYIAGMNARQVSYILRDWQGGMGIYRNMPNIVHLDIAASRRWGGAPW